MKLKNMKFKGEEYQFDHMGDPMRGDIYLHRGILTYANFNGGYAKSLPIYVPVDVEMTKQQILVKLSEIQVSIQLLMNELKKDMMVAVNELKKDMMVAVDKKDIVSVPATDENKVVAHRTTTVFCNEESVDKIVGDIAQKTIYKNDDGLTFIGTYQKMMYYYDKNGVVFVKKNGKIVVKPRTSNGYLITLVNNEISNKYYQKLLKFYLNTDRKLSKMYRKVGGYGSCDGATKNHFCNTWRVPNKNKVSTHYDVYVRERKSRW